MRETRRPDSPAPMPMPANLRHERDLPFPVRGVPGGWRDCWNDPDDSADLRACGEAIEHLTLARALWLGALLRQEIEQKSSDAGAG